MLRGRGFLRVVGMGVALASAALAAASGGEWAAAAEAPADANLRSLPVEELRRLFWALNEEHSTALADEDYERTARIQREMTRLEEEILRRDREAAPPALPDFPAPRR